MCTVQYSAQRRHGTQLSARTHSVPFRGISRTLSFRSKCSYGTLGLRRHLLYTESSTSFTLLSRREDSDNSPECPISIRTKSPCHIDQSEWSFKYHGIKRSNKGSTCVFCSLCGVHVSIAGGGVRQIKRHCSNKKHIAAE